MAEQEVEAEVSGNVVRLECEEGGAVAEGDPILVVESMKMEITIAAAVGGAVVKLLVKPGDAVTEGQVVAIVETAWQSGLMTGESPLAEAGTAVADKHSEVAVDSLEDLFAKNRAWSDRRSAQDPGFFPRLARQQAPRYLWIGCSDSRVPASEIVDLDPGEVFVHRNVANLVVHSDLNCLTVLQYAVDVLKVEHIMIVGHYGCGGMHAVAERRSVGLADNWLRHVEDLSFKHARLLDTVPDEGRADRLCEINVIEQVANVCRTGVVQSAWRLGRRMEVHGLVYGLRDGLLRRVGMSVDGTQSWRERYEASLGGLS